MIFICCELGRRWWRAPEDYLLDGELMRITPPPPLRNHCKHCTMSQASLIKSSWMNNMCLLLTLETAAFLLWEQQRQSDLSFWELWILSHESLHFQFNNLLYLLLCHLSWLVSASPAVHCTRLSISETSTTYPDSTVSSAVKYVSSETCALFLKAWASVPIPPFVFFVFASCTSKQHFYSTL